MGFHEIFNQLNSSRSGLSEQEVKERLKKYGFNELKEKKKLTFLKVLLRQFTNFIIYVLLAAALISLGIGELFNFYVICSITGFVILLGFIQEYRAEKVTEALKKIVQPTTKVLRGGKVREIQTREVVPGDVLCLEIGDKIPADGKIFEAISLKIDEAILTGESLPVEKKEEDLIFAGTQVVYGKCKALVTDTGMETKLGKIAEMIQGTEEKTPLQIKITQLSKVLTIIALVVCGLAFVLGLLKGAPPIKMLIVALALAVAAVPEGLPLSLTLTLAFGMHRMAKHKAIVRKMFGVETLGSTTVICTDKTGTLTKNEMTVEKIFVDKKVFDITGSGYEQKGEFLLNGEKVDVIKEENLTLLLKAIALCNNAALDEKNGSYMPIGDPTEAALVIASAKANLWKEDLENELQRTEEIIFTSERKLMTTIHKRGKEKIAFTKGAPEVLLKKCKFIKMNDKIIVLDETEVSSILKANREFAGNAYRVLGVAYKTTSEFSSPEEMEEDLVFLGLVSMMDSPREEVKKAIQDCNRAGIKVIMITGDNEETAKAIAKKIGLFAKDEKKEFYRITDEKLKGIIEDEVVTGNELDELSDEEFEAIVENICIYARTMPEQKLRIVKALKKKGHIIAMTGDGVNDAPALKKADIGIAMGIKGTDVAKEASVMILQDDNFATIVEAIRQGRTIYENIEKFTAYLLSRNFTEIILIILGIVFLGFDFLPLIALQILFINTFDEVMPAVGLGLDLPGEKIMFEKPRNPKEGILNKRNLTIIISLAAFTSLTAFMIFIFNNPRVNLEKARTLTFATVMISTVLFIPFAFRSLKESVFRIKIFMNKLLTFGVFSTFLLTLCVMYIPSLQKIFELTTLSLADWFFPLFVAFATLIFTDILKKCGVRRKGCF